MVPAGRLRQSFLGPAADGRPSLRPFPVDVGEGEVPGRYGLGDDHEVDRGGHQVRKLPETLAAKALHAVSLDRATDLPAHDETQPRRTFARLPCYEKNESRGGHAQADGLNTEEVASLPEAALTAKRKARCGRQGPLLLVRGRGQAMATLATTIREDLATTGRRHAGTEAVGTGAAGVVRLIRAFHGKELS
jgi:hypothetical protein